MYLQDFAIFSFTILLLIKDWEKYKKYVDLDFFFFGEQDGKGLINHNIFEGVIIFKTQLQNAQQ